jgi:transposase
VEVDRPDRRARRAQGKSDPLDAYSAARAALSGRASVVPKVRDGRIEAIRALRVAPSSAVKARSQAMNQIQSLIVTGPAELPQQRGTCPPLKLIATCPRLRPGHQLRDTEHATKTALRRLARRHQQLSEEIAEADQELHQLVHQVAPALLALPGVAPEVAGQMLISAGDTGDVDAPRQVIKGLSSMRQHGQHPQPGERGPAGRDEPQPHGAAAASFGSDAPPSPPGSPEANTWGSKPAAGRPYAHSRTFPHKSCTFAAATHS